MKKISGISKFAVTGKSVKMEIVFKDTTNKLQIELALGDMQPETLKQLDTLIKLLLREAEESLK